MRSPRVGPARRPGGPATTSLVVVFAYAIWLIFLLQPQWLIAWFGLKFVTRLPAPLFVLLAAVALLRYPATRWYAPLLAVVALAVATMPLSQDLAVTEVVVRPLVTFWLVAVGVLTLVRTPQQVRFIVMVMLLYSYVWWTAFGAVPGQVWWHPDLFNYDAFGPLMVGGAAMSGFGALAFRGRKLKLVALAVSLLCLLGLVSSFTRGAFLAAGVVLLYAWIRSPRKGAMTVGAVLAVAVVVIVGTTIFASVKRQDNATNFFDRIASISEDINTGSGLDRKTIWAAARQIFVHHPVIGVGFGGFGPTAASTFRAGSSVLVGAYAENPGTLYDKALHNAYYQILCEQGLVGVLLWLWLVVDFFRRNRALRSDRFRRAWGAETGGSLDLRFVALGLDAGMVAFLACAYFYNLLASEWFYGILITNRLLYHVLAPHVKAAPAAVDAASRPILRRSQPAP